FQKSGVSIPLIGLAKREETIIVPLTPASSSQRLLRVVDLSHIGEREPFLSPLLVKKESYQTPLPRWERLGEGEKVGSHLAFKEISLPKNSKALHLIMRIRDEAHRFAITYHRKLRSKYALNSFGDIN